VHAIRYKYEVHKFVILRVHQFIPNNNYNKTSFITHNIQRRIGKSEGLLFRHRDVIKIESSDVIAF
jgi:hypothetical protein